MKTFTAAVLAVLAGLANANVAFTNGNYDGITAGSTFTLKWGGNSGPVSIILKNGPSNNLQTVTTIDSNDSGSSFTWNVPAGLAAGNYAFEIVDGSDTNYSPTFSLSSTVSASASASASASGSTSMTSASSTSATSASTSASSSSATTSGSSSSSTSASSTTSTTSTKTTTSASATTTAPNSNDAQGIVAPFLAPLLVAAGVAIF